MKTKLFILMMLIASTSFSQSCSPLVTVNCDSTLTVVQAPLTNASGAIAALYIDYDGLNAPQDVLVPYNPNGNTVVTTQTSISPSFSQYSVTIGASNSLTQVSGAGIIYYPCNSTVIVNTVYDPTINGYVGAPAKIGWTYQDGQNAFDAGLNCTTVSATKFLDSTKKGGRIKVRKNGRWSRQ